MISTTPFQTGYAWREGTHIRGVNATLVGRQIDAIGGEQARRDDIIAAGVEALGGTGEITKCFTQDRDEAARKRWEDEADYLMRSLVPVVVDYRTEEEAPIDQRVWVPVYTETRSAADSGVYRRVPLDLAVGAGESAGTALQTNTTAKGSTSSQKRERVDREMQGWVALMEWRERYGDEPLFASVVAAIESLKG